MPIPETVPIGRFPLGMSNVGDAAALPEGTCRNAVNIDFDNSGIPSRRRGRTKIFPGTDVADVWSNAARTLTLFRDGGTLWGLERGPGGYAARFYRSGLASGHPLSYLEMPSGEVYYTNGLVTGVIANGADGPWGVERPPRQPVLSPLTTGRMHAGVYQVAITFRSATGEESGTGLAATVTVPDGGGISLSQIPVPSFAATVSVYCSPHDGDMLYLYGDYPAGTTGISLSAFQSDYPLETQFGYPPPPGQCLEAFNGRIYIGQGPNVVFTDPQRYGLYKPHLNYLAFGATVTLIKAVFDGLYVGTVDEVYFLSGIDTEALSMRTVLSYGCPLSRPIDTAKSAAIFTNCGWVNALPSGEIQNLMDERCAVSVFASGATLYREDRGIRQLIALMQGGEASPYAAQDYIDYEISRRGSAV